MDGLRLAEWADTSERWVCSLEAVTDASRTLRNMERRRGESNESCNAIRPSPSRVIRKDSSTRRT